MENPSVLTIYTDGASRGNPGQAAFSYVIQAHGIEPIEQAGCLGKMTNNQAEYTALIRALEHAHKLGAHHRLLIHSDSELMVKQMNGEYRVKNEELLDLFEAAKKLVKKFAGGVTLVHVRRAKNKRADALCNEALDDKRQLGLPTASLPTSKPSKSVTEQALACLREAETAWKRGEDAPPVETVWRWLVEILAEHGITALEPSRGRGRP